MKTAKKDNTLDEGLKDAIY